MKSFCVQNFDKFLNTTKNIFSLFFEGSEESWLNLNVVQHRADKTTAHSFINALANTGPASNETDNSIAEESTELIDFYI